MEGHSRLLRTENCRRLPPNYPTGWFRGGEESPRKHFLTGYHQDARIPTHDGFLPWHHLGWMSCDYTRLNPNPSRLAPIALKLDNGRWVLIPGPIVKDRKDADELEKLDGPLLSWRYYYPGFPDGFAGLSEGWYVRHWESMENTRAMSSGDVLPALLGPSDPWFKRYEPPFREATDSEYSRYHRARDGLQSTRDGSASSGAELVREVIHPSASAARVSAVPPTSRAVLLVVHDVGLLVTPSYPLGKCVRRLRQRDFCTRHAYEVYKTQVSFLLPRDPSYRPSRALLRMIDGLDPDVAEDEPESDQDGDNNSSNDDGYEDDDDRALIQSDIEAEYDSASASTELRTVLYSRDLRVSINVRRGNVTSAIIPQLAWPNMELPLFDGHEPSGPPSYLASILTWGMAFRHPRSMFRNFSSAETFSASCPMVFNAAHRSKSRLPELAPPVEDSDAIDAVPVPATKSVTKSRKSKSLLGSSYSPKGAISPTEIPGLVLSKEDEPVAGVDAPQLTEGAVECPELSGAGESPAVGPGTQNSARKDGVDSTDAVEEGKRTPVKPKPALRKNRPPSRGALKSGQATFPKVNQPLEVLPKQAESRLITPVSKRKSQDAPSPGNRSSASSSSTLSGEGGKRGQKRLRTERGGK